MHIFAAYSKEKLIKYAFEKANLISNLLFYLLCRRDSNLQNLGAAETKLLYTLHWIILDAAEECADADFERGQYHTSPFYYLFSIPAISVSTKM